MKPGEHAIFGASSEPVKARANGGHMLHWVVPNIGVALCGRYPGNSAKRMRKRGMWLPLPSDANNQWLKPCKSCASANALRAPAQSANVGSPPGNCRVVANP